MSDETPSVEEIKARLKVEIPVDEEAATKASTENPDVVEELKGLGQQFANALQAAWNSEERQKIETEIREGVQSFVGEVDKAIREARESDIAAKMKDEAIDMKSRVETNEFSSKARDSFVQGLHWLSEELGKLADQFTPKAKEPTAESTPDDSAE